VESFVRNIMFDYYIMEETLKPIIVSMAVAVAFIYVVSTYIKPNTGHKNTDNFLTYIAAQRGQFAHAALLVGLVTLFTDYVLDMVSPE
jgi:hypothetical protein